MTQPVPLHRSKRRLAALAFLDVVGYSRLMSVSEDGTLQKWSELRSQVIEPRIIYWRGRVANRIGDGLLAEFVSALDALQWATDVQKTVARQVAGADRIQLRISLHLADVIDDRDGDVMGDGVNIAARLQAYADPGGVVVTQALLDSVAGKTEAKFVDLGLLHLKNIGRPVRAFRLSQQSAQARSWRAKFLRPRTVIAVSIAALTMIIAAPLSIVHGQKANPHAEAERLFTQASALKCAESPCLRTWLERRVLLEQAIIADPSFARPYAEAALTYTNLVSTNSSADAKADLSAAARLATQAIALAPDQAFGYAVRAAVLRQNPDTLENALFDYTHAISLDPTLVTARANAGWMLILLGRAEEAGTYLESALRDAPNHAFAPAWLTYLGLADLFLQRDGHGERYFQQAVDSQPRDPGNWQHTVERTIALASAKALSGEITAAQRIIADLRQDHPTLSTHNILWNCRCSRNPRFLSGIAELRRGAELAGVSTAG